MEAILGLLSFVIIFFLGYALGYRRAEIKFEGIIKWKNIYIDNLRLALKNKGDNEG